MESAFGVEHGEISKAFPGALIKPVKAARRAVGSKIYGKGEKMVRANDKSTTGYKLRRYGRNVAGL